MYLRYEYKMKRHIFLNYGIIHDTAWMGTGHAREPHEHFPCTRPPNPRILLPGILHLQQSNDEEGATARGASHAPPPPLAGPFHWSGGRERTKRGGQRKKATHDVIEGTRMRSCRRRNTSRAFLPFSGPVRLHPRTERQSPRATRRSPPPHNYHSSFSNTATSAII